MVCFLNLILLIIDFDSLNLEFHLNLFKPALIKKAFKQVIKIFNNKNV